jgi:small conductance mechanosensitive channel
MSTRSFNAGTNSDPILPAPNARWRLGWFAAILLALSAGHIAQAQTVDESTEATEPAAVITLASTPERDDRIRTRLEDIFAEIEPLTQVRVSVSSGVVALSGDVDSMATAARAIRLAGQLEGVVDVQDGLVIDRDLDRRIESTRQVLSDAGYQILTALPLLLAALAVVVLFGLFGAWLRRRQSLFRRINPNVFIASLIGQATQLIFVLLGLVVALVLLDATALLGTILGAAGIAGLAIGFAVRDTVENYIASILLSLRNPFSVNDLVEIDGRLGNVITLTSRATILLSPEGNHVRIPNATVFKAVIINYTRRPERRFDFAVGIGCEQELIHAQEVALAALESVPGVMDPPAAQVIIDALGDSTVTLRGFGWVDQRKHDFAKVRSEAIRRVKQAFDEAGVSMPEPGYRLRIEERLSTASEPQRTGAATDPEPPRHADPDDATHGIDTRVDPTIEERVLSDASADQNQNLLSGEADKEL